MGETNRLPTLTVLQTWFLRKATASSLEHGLPCSFASLSRAGLPRRGHRLFGNVDSIW